MKVERQDLPNLVLAGLAILSVVLVLATRHTPTTTERDARAKNLLPVWREDELERLELTAGSVKLLLERGPDGWSVRAPDPEPADDAAVSKLVNAVSLAQAIRRLDGADLHAHGLDQPRATLRLEMGRQKLTLSLGEDAPSPAGGAYVALDGAGNSRIAAVVSPELRKAFDTRADDLRERGLVKLGPKELAELVVERPSGTLRLVRGRGLSFRLDGAERASRDATEPVLTALARLSATRFLAVAEAEKARGTAPLLRVTLKPRDAKAEKTLLELGGPCPGAPAESVFVVRAPRRRAGCLGQDALAPLSVERNALRDPYPFDARKDEVEGMLLERDGKRLSLERRGTAFLLREPSEAQVEIDAGNRRLEAIVRAPTELVERPDAKALGFEPPSGKLTLRVIGDDDKAIEEVLELGKTAPDGTLYVRRVEDRAVLAVNRESARAFVLDSTLLRSQKVLDFALSALAELDLSAPERQLLRRVPSGFSLVEPKGFEHDGELATEAVLALGSLTALRWVADADDGTFGLKTPALTAHARIDPPDAGPADFTLLVGRPTPGGSFAAIDGEKGVFLMERSAVERLSTLLIDRATFMADPGTLARVTFSHGAREVVLERRAGTLVAKAGEVPEVTLARALEALGSLRAEAAVHSGPAQPSEGFASPWLSVKLEPNPGLGKPRSFRIGGNDSYRGAAVRTARADGVDATFVIAESKLVAFGELF